MNVPCHVIEDLLLLYKENTCSIETKTLIEAHLPGCNSCKACYDALCSTEEADPAMELQRAASFRSVRKKLHRKRLIAAAASAGVLIGGCLIASVILKSSIHTVESDHNLSVAMTDGALVGRLQGSRYNGFRSKRVTVQDGEQEIDYLFYSLEETAWDSLFTSSEVFSEYTLCYADRSAGTVDYVYYYTGEYTGLESLSKTELQAVTDKAVLLWSKDDSRLTIE